MDPTDFAAPCRGEARQLAVKRYYFEGEDGIRLCIPCRSLASAKKLLKEMYGQDPAAYALVKAERMKLTEK